MDLPERVQSSNIANLLLNLGEVLGGEPNIMADLRIRIPVIPIIVIGSNGREQSPVTALKRERKATF